MTQAIEDAVCVLDDFIWLEAPGRVRGALTRLSDSVAAR
jgi:hypothetical protein